MTWTPAVKQVETWTGATIQSEAWSGVTKQIEIWSGETTGAAPWLYQNINYLVLVDGSFLMLNATPYAIELENQTRDESQFT